jgi:phage FluMu protein Com
MKSDPAHDPGNLRCGKCNKLLAKGRIEAGEIELLCPRCKSRIVLRAISPNAAPRDGLYGDRYARNQSSSRS